MGVFRRFSPYLYQGVAKNDRYFEGWYIKATVAGGRSLAFIPGIAMDPDDPHSFVQFIDGHLGQSAYYRYGAEEFSWSDEPFEVTIGPNRFTRQGLSLSLENGDYLSRPGQAPRISGSLGFGPWLPYPSSFAKAGIMGPYGLLGFLQCYHGIVSATHSVDIDIQLTGEDDQESITQKGAQGYIEKDWGSAFPREYLWTQANDFPDPGLSVFASVADIPFGPSSFPGFISFVRSPELPGPNGYQVFATWNGAKLRRLRSSGSGLELAYQQGPWTLELSVISEISRPLKAPTMGKMERIIKESVDAQMTFQLCHEDKVVLEGGSPGAGLELVGIVQNLASRLKANRNLV